MRYRLTISQLSLLRLINRVNAPLDAGGFHSSTVKSLEVRGYIEDVGIWPDHKLIITKAGKKMLKTVDGNKPKV